MNITSSSTPQAAPSRILPVSLLVAGLALTACSTTHQKNTTDWGKNPVGKIEHDTGADILIKKMLQKNGEEIARLIAEKIDTDTAFHSLEVIKSFIKEELEKRGITSVIIWAQLLPFIPTDDGQYAYLSFDIRSGTPRGGIYFSLETDDKEKVVPLLTHLLDNFERYTSKKVLEAFVAGIAENGGAMEVTWLEQKIKALLENDQHLFLQHGFNLQWVKIGQDNETGEVNIYLELYNMPNNEIINLPIPTGIIEEKPKKEKSRGRSWETMLASAE